jgi:hypothetical protein
VNRWLVAYHSIRDIIPVYEKIFTSLSTSILKFIFKKWHFANELLGFLKVLTVWLLNFVQEKIKCKELQK